MREAARVVEYVMNCAVSLNRSARWVSAVLLIAIVCVPALAQTEQSIPEEIEWTWEVRPSHPNAKLPNVLLLGDSISRNYFPEVTRQLAGAANVYLMAVSTSVGDPRLPRQIAEFQSMQGVRFRVVHFNNGMHGWDYTEEVYKANLRQLVTSARSLLEPHGTLIWASLTPVQPNAFNGATNPRVDARNQIAQALMKSEGIAVDDQHTLMLKHQDLYEDTVHFGPAGADIMGDQAAAMIRDAFSKAQP